MSHDRTVALPEGTTLVGRYVLGSPRAVSEAGIAYTAFDKKLRMPCEVFEYLPAEFAVRDVNGTVIPREDTDPSLFAEKCRKLQEGAMQRFQDAGSAIYDITAVNGSVYLIQVCAKNNAIPSDASPQPAVTDEAQTRDIGGLFAGNNPSPDDTPVSDEPTAVFPHELLFDPPASPPAVEQPVPEKNEKDSFPPPSKPQPVHPVTPKPVPPAEEEEEPADSGRLNMKLLLVLLAGVLLLLILGIFLFVNILQQISGQAGEDMSLIGVPIAEISTVSDTDYLIVGTGSDLQYAQGMVIAEEKKGGVMHVIVNSAIPAYIVPDFTGMTEESALALLNRTHYNNAVGTVTGNIRIEQIASDEYPAGTVVSQSPQPGTRTSSSIVTLHIAVSDNKPVSGKTTRLPDLCGKEYAPYISGYPLLISDKVYSMDAPAGTILSQYPAAGAEWPEGAECYVVVSLGEECTYVPDLLYRTVEQAEEMLYAKGLSVVIEYAYHMDVQEGLVASQTPVCGTAANFGDTVTLIVSGEGAKQTGPTIENTIEQIHLQTGETCTMELETENTIVYHSSNPAVVSVDTTGIITAHTSGTASIIASISGTSIATPVTVAYPEDSPNTGTLQTGDKLSLSAQTKLPAGKWRWTILRGSGTVTEEGVFETDTAGTMLVSSTSGNQAVLFLLTVTKAQEKAEYISIAKSAITNAESAKQLIEKKGLTCVIEEEYNDTYAAGKIIEILYTGYSDSTAYHFTPDSKITLVVSRGTASVVSVSIFQKPNKLTYTVGEKLNTAGLVLAVSYEDGSVKNISTGFTTSYDFSAAGRKTVAVSYSGRKASFPVEVIDKSSAAMTISKKPNKTTYYTGEKLDTTGLEVKISYTDGSTKTFTTGFETSYDFQKAGTVKVTVKLEGQSAAFTVTVKENTVEMLEVIRYPTKSTYYEGESIDTTGMQLRAYYADGTKKTITSGWTVSGKTDIIGQCPVTVTYGGKSVQFNIAVQMAEILAIHVLTEPVKTEYSVGDEIDLTGLVLSATLSNGNSRTFSYPESSIRCTYDFSKAGNPWVTVEYRGLECMFQVKVNPVSVTKLVVYALPEKVTYLVNEKLDTTGLVLAAEYSSGVWEKITTGYTTNYDFREAGETEVFVRYGDQSASFTVTVVENNALYMTPASLTLTIGESQTVQIFSQLPDSQMAYSVTVPSVISVTPVGNALSVKALAAGESKIILQCGDTTAECTVSVTENAPAADAQYTADLVISNKSSISFMPTLVLRGSDTKDLTVKFSAVLTYDPTKITLADYGAVDDNITVQSDNVSSVTISGTVTVPKGKELPIAYFFFFGTDTQAYTLTVY